MSLDHGSSGRPVSCTGDGVERQPPQSRDQELHSSTKWMGQGIEKNFCKCPDNDRCLLGNQGYMGLLSSPTLNRTEMWSQTVGECLIFCSALFTVTGPKGNVHGRLRQQCDLGVWFWHWGPVELGILKASLQKVENDTVLLSERATFVGGAAAPGEGLVPHPRIQLKDAGQYRCLIYGIAWDYKYLALKVKGEYFQGLESTEAPLPCRTY